MKYLVPDNINDEAIEGIGTFADSIAQVKTVLSIGTKGSIEILESDLTSILKDLLDSQEKGNSDYTKTLLKTHLPANLILWRTTGLPSLQQTKDC